MTNKVSISTLPFKFEELCNAFDKLKQAGADYAHCDIMDGEFVANKTYTPEDLSKIANQMPLPLDVHLMVNNPLQFVKIISNYAEFCTIHCELFNAEDDLLQAINIIKNERLKVGIAVDLMTPIEIIQPVLKYVDLVLVMSVKAGAGGQLFNPVALSKIEYLKNFKENNNLKFIIEVDGGINGQNAEMCVNAGADILVSGSYVASADDMKSAIDSLKFGKI